jgi:ribonuclease E
MKRILINATQQEELRVAIVDGQKLHDLDIEVAAREQTKSNIYKGRITRVEPSLEACFVEYGAERHGFLSLKEISREYFRQEPNGGKLNIRDLVTEGQEVIVQVEKEERGNKGAALSTFISLAGRYLVLMPNNPRAGGISRRVEGEERDELRETLNQVECPDGMGVIVRTNGIGRTPEELQWDLNYLVEIWTAITKAASERKAPFLVYQESNIILRALRDYLRADIGEVIIDNPTIYEHARGHLESVMPGTLQKLKLYDDEIPLFSRFQVESQIESAHQRKVDLPSGGSIVIDHTEALTSIDINSARATGGKDIEETALQTNLEAADEIARQLRLRDLGGLIVIDFIDMNSNRNQRQVEDCLRDATEIDRARIQIGRISRFGLLEMSRQRLRPSLGEHTHIPCPRCSGHGQIRAAESLALSVLRLMEEEAMKDKTGRVVAQVPVEVGTFLLNEKRDVIRQIEARCKVQITLVPNPTLLTPKFEIRRVRADNLQQDDNAAASYRMLEDYSAPARDSATVSSNGSSKPAAKPAVGMIAPTAPPPAPAPAAVTPVAAAPVLLPTESLWSRIKRWLGIGTTASVEASEPESKPQQKPARRSSRGGGEDGRSRRRDGGQQRRGEDRRERRGNRKPRNESAKATEAGAGTEKPQRTAGARDQDRTQNDRRDENLGSAAARPATQAVEDNSERVVTAAAGNAAESASDTDGEKTGRRRRRRRGGRNRRRDQGVEATMDNDGNVIDGNDDDAAPSRTHEASADDSTNDGQEPNDVRAGTDDFADESAPRASRGRRRRRGGRGGSRNAEDSAPAENADESSAAAGAENDRPVAAAVAAAAVTGATSAAAAQMPAAKEAVASEREHEEDSGLVVPLQQDSFDDDELLPVSHSEAIAATPETSDISTSTESETTPESEPQSAPEIAVDVEPVEPVETPDEIKPPAAEAAQDTPTAAPEEAPAAADPEASEHRPEIKTEAVHAGIEPAAAAEDFVPRLILPAEKAELAPNASTAEAAAESAEVSTVLETTPTAQEPAETSFVPRLIAAGSQLRDDGEPEQPVPEAAEVSDAEGTDESEDASTERDRDERP